jgi:hypothetical protein
MAEKVCAICLCDIPNYPREALIDLGYSGFQLGKSEQEYFCPKHSAKERAEYIAKQVRGGIK